MSDPARSYPQSDQEKLQGKIIYPPSLPSNLKSGLASQDAINNYQGYCEELDRTLEDNEEILQGILERSVQFCLKNAQNLNK